MKKLLLLSFVALLASFITYSQQKGVVWTEDFEGEWSVNWHVETGTWEVGTPTSGPGSAFAGQKCAATVLAGNYPAYANTRLIRHTTLTIPGADQNPRLRFWHWYSIYSGDKAVVQIKVGTGEWQTISDLYDHSSSGVWSYPSIDLKSYAGLTVQLAFYFTSNSDGYTANGWYIDDLAIVTGPIVYNNPETWELGLGDWYADRGTWEVGTPTNGPGKAYNGTKCAATVLTGNYSASISSRLISPLLTIPAADQNPRLRFWHWYSIYSGDEAVVQIKIGTGEWQTISDLYDHSSSGVWSYPAIDLKSFAGLTVQLAFYFTSNSDGYTNPGWYIDDLAIITGPLVYNDPETWETGLGDWYADRGTWEVGTPTTGPGKAYNGTKCAATVLNGNHSVNINSRLISPLFTIPGVDQNPRLRFWHWYSIYSGDEAVVQIKVGTGEWQTISDLYDHSSSGVWSYPSIDLKLYAGLTVQLSFYFTSNSDGYTNPGWYIDDLAIITGPIVYNNPETWETGLGEWYADRGTWEVGTPTNGPGKAYNGTKCAATVLTGNYSTNISSRLISPLLTIPAADQNPRLRFWHWYSIYSGDQAYVQIKIGSEDWQTIFGPFTNSSGNVWSNAFIDLSPYANKKAQFSFYFTSNSDGYTSSGWYIDDLSFDNITWVKESEVQKINIYPNPFSEKATIQFDDTYLSGYMLTVYNISGTKVMEIKDIRSDKIELEKGALPAGIYIVELKGDRVYRNKIIIR